MSVRSAGYCCHWFVAVLVCLMLHGNVLSAADQEVDYVRDIKPILSDKCYACHGPDANQRKGELRVDIVNDSLENVITSGKAAESEMLARITSDDPDALMPPADSKKPRLTKAEVDLIRRWIDAGAKYDEHWAYTELKRPAVPKTAAATPSAIDRFVAAHLQQHGYKASPAADRRTLIRRLSFDLTGLPPKPAEIDAFLADKSPKAYENLVDRLLASPHYGERMAMYWLDLVRYADTNGIHGDNHREISPYRDWVIAAFNNNMPFDRFTTEQLAGDLLPKATVQQKIASGYNRLLMTTREGGAQAKEYMAKYSADRVRNVSSVWLGATMGCCECHDHKYDPFTMKDFYSLASYFADIKEVAVGSQPPVKLPTPGQAKQVAVLDTQIAPLQKILNTPTPQLAAAQAKWEVTAKAALARRRAAWKTVKLEKSTSSGGATLTPQEDLSVLASGKNSPQDIYTVTLPTELEKITGIRLEALTHASIANKSLGRGGGNFVLSQFEVEVVSLDNLKPQPVKIAKAEADYSQKNFPIANAIDGKPNTGWAVDGQKNIANRTAVFTFAKPIPAGLGTTLTIRLRHESASASHNIGRFRLALTTLSKPSLSPNGGLPADVVKALPLEKRTAPQQAAVAKYYRTIAPALAAPRGQMAKLQKQKNAIVAAYPATLISVSIPPRAIRILPRGNWLDESGPIVQPNTPGFISQSKTTANRSTRLDLAKWMLDKQNPLVARVYVNRLWKIMFGQGIVTTPDDFGSQGAVPSHRQLLDWLAAEFIESGWDTKHLLKLMATSAAYQQSSMESSELRQRDPANRHLSRQNRYRLDAEMVRDNALSISGLLSLKLGGRSVKPYQPAGYWAHLNFPKRKWQADGGDNLYRRGLYTYWCRTFLHPAMLAFDAPSREECAVQRSRSNTPLQALVLLNDPQFVEAARVFAAQIVKEGGKETGGKIQFAFHQSLGRAAKEQEVKILTALYQKHHQQYSQDKAAADEVLKAGASPMSAGQNAIELAAWTSVARVILNLHETITRY